jgi:RNA polymerase sigma-70 factor (ECF subfamily)
MWDASDEALLAGYATGDPDAAAAFVRRFQDRAFGLALQITRDRADADDVAQDAMVRAWRYAAAYDPRRGSVLGWLLTIVRNVALDRVRIRGRRPEHVSSPMLGSAADVADESIDLADAVVVHDDAAHVAAAMRSLPDEQREALLATTIGGLSGAEYGQAAGLPLGTVKTRIRLGLRKLRHELGMVPR